MKTKRMITLLLTAVMLSSCLLPLTGCKNKTETPSNPFNDLLPGANDDDGQQGKDEHGNTDSEDANSSGNADETDERLPIDDFGRYFGASDYDANAEHGEKKLYYDEVSDTICRTSYNGIVFQRNDPNFFSYEISNPRKLRYVCFDPICEHLYKEYCTSSLEGWYVNAENPDIKYIARFVVDSYDYENVPVIYMSFLRTEHYFINGVMHDRESVYCIERFDMKTGQRTVVIDYIDEIIGEMFTYGDYIYFTKVDANNNHILCRVHKSGGEVITLDESRLAFRALDAVDGMIYYLADERYICRTDPELSESEQLADIADLSSYNEYKGYYFYGARGGYIYYCTNVETVYSTKRFDKAGMPYENGYKMDLCRLPLNNLAAAPELLVEDMLEGVFTDDTFFYCPAVLEDVEQSINGELNNCNGTMYALDLNTLERTTVCENTGFNFFFYHAISSEDDIIGVKGRPYTKETALVGGEQRILMGKKSGGGLEYWYTQGRYEYENRQE